jgi:hypothetical protein
MKKPKTVDFLINPKGSRSRRTPLRKRSARKMAKKRARVRVASPGRAVPRRRHAARNVAAAHSQGVAMAKKGKGRKGGSRKNPAGKRRRFRRNPGGSLVAQARGVLPFVTGAAVDAAESLAGIVAARKVRALVGMAPGTVPAMLTEAAVGLIGGFALSRVNKNLGARFAQGGLLAPMMTAVQKAGIPFVSDALGDDGYLLGDYVGDEGIAGYIGRGGAETVGDYIGDAQETAWAG